MLIHERHSEAFTRFTATLYDFFYTLLPDGCFQDVLSTSFLYAAQTLPIILCYANALTGLFFSFVFLNFEIFSFIC